MSHEHQLKWSAGNDGFGYPDRESPPGRTTPPAFREEIKALIRIARNRRFKKWKRREACDKLIGEYGTFYMSNSDSEYWCGHDTESSGSDGSGSDGSGSDGSDSSDSEQCSVASQISQSMGQQLLPDDLDAKSKSE